MTTNAIILERGLPTQEDEKVEQARELTLEEAELEYERLFGMAIRAAGLD